MRDKGFESLKNNDNVSLKLILMAFLGNLCGFFVRGLHILELSYIKYYSKHRQKL